MLIDFNAMTELCEEHFYGGEKAARLAMHSDELNYILRGRLEPGASIGTHRHEESSEIIYIISGAGMAVCDGIQERLTAGMCHYCPKGSEHTLINDGGAELVFFAAIPSQ